MFNDGKVIVSLFEPKTTKEVVLTENGKILDKYCTSLKGEPDLNGNFRLTGNFINKDSIFKDIIEGAILKVRNEYDEDEVFRITTITPTPFLISIIAFQITITDTKAVWLEDIRPTNLTGIAALQHMYNGSNSMGFPKEIILSSDIDITNTAYYQLMNLHDALFTCDQSFINRWGGEVYRHQYNLTINKQIGSYNGVTIRENKNLVGFEANKSTDNLCTVAVGKGYDGILGDYIESPLKDKYDRAYTKVIEYSDVKVKTDSDINEDNETMLFDTLEEAKAELNRRIKNEFKNNKIDEIQATYNIDFLELSKTEEYKDYVQAERLYLGDFLDVIVDSLDIKIKTRVISKEIDYLQNRVTKMTVSNIPVESMSKTDSQIVGSIRDILSKNNNIDLGNYVDTVIKSGMKNSNVIVRKNEILIMDTDDIKTAKNVWRWNGAAMAHSSTGYYGKYNIGFTMEGILNANIIKAGILSTILIQNSDGSFQIDLSGSSGASFFNDGQLAMRMENNALKFYNWGKDGDHIGELTALCRNSEANKPLIGLVNDLDSAVSIGYKSKTDPHTFPSYIEFDKYNIMGDKQIAPIKVYEDVEMGNRKLYNPILTNDHYMPVYVDGVEVARFQKDGFFLNAPIYNKNNILVFDPMAPQGGGFDGDDNLRKSVVNSARKLIGKWYVYGGNYPPLGTDSGTDCSGLMQWAYNDNGIKISRTTYTQIKEGTEVSESNLKPGDLVFPSTEHVFMYSGEKDGKHMCVEAAHTGTQLRERAFTWGSGYRARRIIKDSGSSHGGSGGSPGGTAGSKASSNIIYYVKGIEGFAPNYYYDSVGVKTLGYGMTGAELSGVSTPLSEASATHYLTKYFNRDYYEPVLRIVKSRGVSNPLQREIDAFASFAYNNGVPGFSESTLLKKYAAGERGESIHHEFGRWVHAGGSVSQGLVRRREEEWKIFSGAAHVAGYNGRPYIDIIGGSGSVTSNGGYGAAPY